MKIDILILRMLRRGTKFRQLQMLASSKVKVTITDFRKASCNWRKLAIRRPICTPCRQRKTFHSDDTSAARWSAEWWQMVRIRSRRASRPPAGIVWTSGKVPRLATLAAAAWKAGRRHDISSRAKKWIEIARSDIKRIVPWLCRSAEAFRHGTWRPAKRCKRSARLSRRRRRPMDRTGSERIG